MTPRLVVFLGLIAVATAFAPALRVGVTPKVSCDLIPCEL